MTRSTSQRTWSVPGKLIGDLTVFTVLVWLGLMVVWAVSCFANEYWGTVHLSVYDLFTQLFRWWMLAMGVHLTWTVLPLNIAHGQTRRDSAIESGIFITVFSAAIAVLASTGYLIERALYSVMDWPQSISEQHLFADPTDAHLIFVEFFIRFMISTTIGAFAAAGFYRSSEGGWITLPIGFAFASASELALASDWGPFGLLSDWIGDPGNPPLGVAVLIGLAVTGALFGLTWGLVRDMPMRASQAA